jgi:hypothetical protein
MVHGTRLLMIRLLACFAGVLFGCAGSQSRDACSAVDGADASDLAKGPGYSLLKQFSDALREYDISEGQSYPEMEKFIQRKATEILSPHKEVLHQQALWQLRRVPRETPVDTGGWVSPTGVDSGAEMAQLIEQIEMYIDEIAREYPLTLVAWDPYRLFTFLRSMMYSRVYSPGMLGNRLMLENFIISLVVRLNDDGERPLLAIQSQSEVFAVQFRFDAERGIYLPEKITWLVKTKPAPAAEEVPSGTNEEAGDWEEIGAEEVRMYQASTYALPLLPNDEFLQSPLPDKNEDRYRGWKPNGNIPVGKGGLNRLAVSADGKFMLVAGAREATVRVYSMPRRKAVGNFAVEGVQPDEPRKGDVLFWPSDVAGPYFLVGNGAGLILYSAADGQRIRWFNHEPISKMRFSPDGRYLLTTTVKGDGESSLLTVYDVIPSAGPEAPSLGLIGEIEETGQFEDLALSPDNQWLAMVMSPSRTVVLADVRTGEKYWTVYAPEKAAAVDFSPDGTQIAVGGAHLLVLSAENPEQRAVYSPGAGHIGGVRFAPGGDAIALSFEDGRIQLVQTDISSNTPTLLKALRSSRHTASSPAAFTPDGSQLVSADDKSIIFFGN